MGGGQGEDEAEVRRVGEEDRVRRVAGSRGFVGSLGVGLTRDAGQWGNSGKSAVWPVP